jgi:hypothetical protein
MTTSSHRDGSHRENAERRLNDMKEEARVAGAPGYTFRGGVSPMFYSLAVAVIMPIGAVLVIGPVVSLIQVLSGESDMRREIVTGGLLGLSILSVCGALIRMIVAGNPAPSERVRIWLEVARSLATGVAAPMFIGSVVLLVALGAEPADGTPMASLVAQGGWTAALIGAGGVVTGAMLAMLGTSDLPRARRQRRKEARESTAYGQSPDVL